MRQTVGSILGFVIIVVGVILGIFFIGNFPVTAVGGDDGVVDLITFPFDTQAAETDAFVHYPDQLLTPDELYRGQVGNEPANYGTFAANLKVTNDDINDSYVLMFNSPEFASRIYVNGEKVDEVGIVSQFEDVYVPARRNVYLSANPIDSNIELVLQYSNFRTADSHNPTITIGSPSLIYRLQTHRDFLKYTILAVYLMGFIIFAGMYLFNHKNKSNLIFSLICLVLSIQDLFFRDQFFIMMKQGSLMEPIFTLQYVVFGLLLILLFAYINSLFPVLIGGIGRRRVYAGILLFIAISVFTRGQLPRLSAIFFVILGAVVIVYLFYRVIKIRKSVMSSQMVSAAGLELLFGVMLQDLLYYMNIHIGPLGQISLLLRMMVVFIFIQMVALFLSFLQVERQLGEIREKEAALSAKNETLETVDKQRIQFLSSMSHELRTPLTVVSNYAQLTKEYMKQFDGKGDYVQDKMLLISSEAERMAVMVDQMLDIARIEEGRMVYDFKETDLQALIYDLIEVYYPILNKNRNTLETEISDDLPPVMADDKRMQQVLLNLINNAVRFTKKGFISIRAYAKKNEIAIEVEDTGIGMTEQQLAGIFKRYTTTKDANDKSTGTGLGLYIVNAIVRDHDGRITVESEVGKGSKLTVYLPITGS
ncbi:signal transduction histidine kinase [Lachnospiraceae bacterium PF1-21]|uniref:histidine kinase n=1 Tax=Ohessyouella blattaphilus TaxID=2949333 RepID=A0ABT1EGP1_9FIRM|nr:ATP-binding protein [Ohessyouella blattaphilus]MCP1109871.1 ATP-binding protein [Ohessyouella blattaphilus]MCR8563265.1 ATP-binding protein [Ohessyouella blattaphilus]MDL2250330.1 hypothetical protein [Lachnospiraceae bacterium OttesenSCG-928-J05]